MLRVGGLRRPYAERSRHFILNTSRRLPLHKQIDFDGRAGKLIEGAIDRLEGQSTACWMVSTISWTRRVFFPIRSIVCDQEGKTQPPHSSEKSDRPNVLMRCQALPASSDQRRTLKTSAGAGAMNPYADKLRGDSIFVGAAHLPPSFAESKSAAAGVGTKESGVCTKRSGDGSRATALTPERHRESAAIREDIPETSIATTTSPNLSLNIGFTRRVRLRQKLESKR